MKLHEVMTYPGGTGEVFAMLTDEVFWRDVSAAMRALRSSVSVRSEGGGAVVHVVRVMPAHVPDLVRAWVGDEIEIEQTERWSEADGDGRRAAGLLVRIAGKPVRFPADMVLEPTADGSRQTVHGRIEVRVPLGGAVIAAEIATALRAAMTVQQQIGSEYLTA